MSTEQITAGPTSGAEAFDPGARWRVNPSVAVRPEPFGALLYHFGTRRLTFLKDRRLLEVISALDDHATALAACEAAGVEPHEQSRFTIALQRLADIDMLVRPAPEDSTR